MIDIRHLRYFCTLAETLHFGRAAMRLNLSQPPLSRQIAALEKELGVTLVNRGTRTVALTNAGKRFHVDAEAILASLNQAVKNAVAASLGEEGALSVGFTSCAAYNVVPAFANAYSAAFPKVSFKIRELMSDDLTSNLLTGKIDLAIMFPPEPHLGLNTRTVHKEPICAALPASHPLADAPRIKIADLAGDPFVISPRSAAPELYDTIIGYCRTGGFQPEVRLQALLQQTILNLVAEGVGTALVPRSMAKAQLSGVVFKPLVKAPVVHQVVAWTNGNLNPCLKGFLDLPQSKERFD